jgi:hypothetical protein
MWGAAVSDDKQLRERLASALVEGGHLTPGLCAAYADYLLPIVKGYAAMEVRRFYLDAADEAVHGKRRGPNAIGDWLLDIGRARADELRP